LIKSDGDMLVFFTRPIAMWLAAATLVIVTWPLFKWLLQQRQRY
jgi:putative tricarboxylic transport membrane protein